MEAKRGRSTPIKRNKKKRKRTKKRDQRTSFVGGPTRDENRASRLAPWKAKLLGPKPGERSWSARLSVSHRLPLFLLRFFVSSSHSRRATIAFLFCLCSARCALSFSLSFSLPRSLSPLSLSQGENGSWPFPSADFAANPARGGSTSTPLYPCTSPGPAALFATLLRSGPLRSRRVAVFLRGIPFLYARDCIVRSFNAP